MYDNIIGKRFNRLVVIKNPEKRQRYSKNGSKNGNRIYCKCICDCGNIIDVRYDHLSSNKIKSCGCLGGRKFKNGIKISRINKRMYKIWSGIKERCNNEKSSSYKNYGGRGIVLCMEWSNDFLNFYNWSINNGYRDDLTIDRIDVNGNYCPENCRWITKKEQARNTRKNIYLKYNGKMTCISEISELSGIHKSTLYYRLKNGYNLTDSLVKHRINQKGG